VVDSLPTPTERVQLTRNDLMGTIPSEIGNLSDLGELDGSGPQFQRCTSNDSIPHRDLVVLGLGRNEIQGSVPTEMGHLTVLGAHSGLAFPWKVFVVVHTCCWFADTLGLERNPFLQGTVPTEFGHLTTLRHVAFDSTRLMGTVPTELGLLTGLEILSLQSTDLEGSVPDEVCALEGVDIKADCSENMTCSCCSECCYDGIGCIPQ